jgi:hypothetical protein
MNIFTIATITAAVQLIWLIGSNIRKLFSFSGMKMAGGGGEQAADHETSPDLTTDL